MSDTCRLFPPFGDPWPSCLLPSPGHTESDTTEAADPNLVELIHSSFSFSVIYVDVRPKLTTNCWTSGTSFSGLSLTVLIC